MTVETTLTKVRYSGNGAATSSPVPFAYSLPRHPANADRGSDAWNAHHLSDSVMDSLEYRYIRLPAFAESARTRTRKRARPEQGEE
jgi:hypothetical protein